jgi:serine/threonine protein phosphatase 1
VLSPLKSRGQRRLPRLVGDQRLYVIGDIHGRADLLDVLLSKIDADVAADPCRAHAVMGIGDYVDRGPQSREVLDRLVACVRRRETVLLKGNHETYLLEFLRDPSVLGDWRQYGGLQTLVSYGLRPSLNPGETEADELSRAFASILPWEAGFIVDSRRISSVRRRFRQGDRSRAHAGAPARGPSQPDQY